MMFALFGILASGVGLGALRVFGFALGSAGVVIAAITAGHFGVRIAPEIGELGMVLFIYAVGLQAGPRFFRAFSSSGKHLLLVAAAPTVAAALCAIGMARLSGAPLEAAVGLLAGSLASTPALAAAVDTLREQLGRDASMTSVAYGLVYPISLIASPLLLQLIASVRRGDLAADAEALEKREREVVGTLETHHFKITNPNCFGKTIAEVRIRSFEATVSRVTRGGDILSADPTLKLEQGDVISAVCTASAAKLLLILFGEESQSAMELGRDVISVDLEISIPDITEKPLSSLDFYGKYKVVITRVRRQGIELLPDGSTVLQIGDHIRIVGAREAIDAFRAHSGVHQHRMVDTNMLPVLLGIWLGTVLGSIPIGILPGFRFRLGPAGGCFIASLLIGHFGKLGPFRMYVPAAARNLARELGLLLFLASAGCEAGSQLTSVFTEQGAWLLVAGVLLNLAALGTALLVPILISRRSFLEAYGMACGALTNSLPLAYARERSNSDQASLAYANVYPLALIFKIMAAQGVLWALQIMGSK